MRILFVSGELIGAPLCLQLLREGHDVRLYIENSGYKNCLGGLATKVEHWQSELPWVGQDGIVVFDDVIFGQNQDRLRRDGYRVVGGCAEADRLELDRGHFQSVARRLGLATLPYRDFPDARAAMDFVRENPARWVVKQSGHLSYLNHISERCDGADCIEVLQSYLHKAISPVHLQLYKEGIEVGVARYFNGEHWVGPVEINHEHKRLLDGDRGILTPEMGTVMWYCRHECRLFRETLGKFEDYLRAIGFKGDIDLNCIVREDGAWPIEATPRFGSPAVALQVALHRSPWAEFLTAISDGSSFDLETREGEFAVGISLVAPPFPYVAEDDGTAERVWKSPPPPRSSIEFGGMSAGQHGDIHFEEVSKDGETYFWSGTRGCLAHVTATATEISAARHSAYRRLSSINCPGAFFRRDIGSRVADRDLPLLEHWGWLS